MTNEPDAVIDAQDDINVETQIDQDQTEIHDSCWIGFDDQGISHENHTSYGIDDSELEDRGHQE